MVNLSRKILAKKRFQKEPSLKIQQIKINLFRDPYEELLYKVTDKVWLNGQFVYDAKRFWKFI